ncbi:hypothetical protein HGRIS_000040 [Hohenbuehelia grisea]|uniref:Uncharacterized protein n=1 Tax=Hohenbuehelia grisea TaxID=104357 RepID=A0ABR3JQ17_9AGAR
MSSNSNEASANALRQLQNNLDPPFGTSFFKTERIRILNEEKIPVTMIQIKLSEYTITWDVQLYKYAVNGDPHDPNFIENGGQIYVMLVHSGSIQTTVNLPSMKFEFEVAAQKDSSDVSVLYQYPTTGSGMRVDNQANVLSYEIDFGQTFQMLTNAGNETVSFEAKYCESFIRVDSAQRGDKVSSKAMFAITPNSGENDPELGTLPSNTIYQIYGFSLLTNQAISAWPAKYTFTHRMGLMPVDGATFIFAPAKSSTVNINLGF